MKRNRMIALLLSLAMLFSLAACGGKTTAPEQSGKTEEELLAQENEILSANNELWEKVFASMDKNVTESTLQNNYGDLLLDAVEKAKDQFSDEEYQTLKTDAGKIRDIEAAILALGNTEQDGGQADDTAQSDAFPAFQGKDLDGNSVDSSLFADNAFTVVNFWFNGCKPCVEELDDLNVLNERIKEQGGELIGVNTETLDGNE